MVGSHISKNYSNVNHSGDDINPRIWPGEPVLPFVLQGQRLRSYLRFLLNSVHFMSVFYVYFLMFYVISLRVDLVSVPFEVQAEYLLTSQLHHV